MRDIGIVQFRRLASPAARPEHQRQEKVQEMSDHRHVADATRERFEIRLMLRTNKSIRSEHDGLLWLPKDIDRQV